jgi:hypothetical protein
MRAHSRHVCFLSLVATLLTLSASGDDFCLARFAFPLEVPWEVLPLDDPNSDFLSARKSAAVDDHKLGVSGKRPSCDRQTLGCTLLGIARAIHRDPPGMDLNTPLLC